MARPKYLKEVYAIIEKAKVLGSRELTNGTRLIGHVPHIAPEAYFHFIFEPLGEKDLDKMTEELGKQIPIPLETFYFFNNGINMFSGSLRVHGFRKNYKRKGDDAWQPFDLAELNTYYSPADADDTDLFIGGYKEDKSMLYFKADDPKVYWCTHESTKPLHEWPSFEDMLLSEAKRLQKLFDNTGRLIKGIKSTLPG